MLILRRTEIEALLDVDRLVDRLEHAMVDLSSGRAHVPARIAAAVPERDGMLAAMPAFVPSLGALAAKLVSVFPHERPSHRAVIVCFDPRTGAPSALLDGTYITAARTAAGSALATRWLARPEASRLAVLGTGVQARAHALAIARSRPLSRVLVAGRDPARAARLAEALTREIACAVEVAATFADACAGADIVCATTHAAEPVVCRGALRPGTHVCSVGYNTTGREVDADTVATATVVVESRAAALAPPPAGSTDLLWALRDGRRPPDWKPAEIGEVIDGRREGRSAADEITLYKSVGVGVQDAAAAMLAIEAARQAGVGVHIDI